MPKAQAPDPDWKDNFKSSTMKRNFTLGLSHSMIEMLCAAADDVMWDRFVYSNIHAPDNYFATQNALIKRGLLERKSAEEIKARMATRKTWTTEEYCEGGHHRLTPAGEALVNLFRVTGMFIQSDSSIRKKARRA